MLPSSGSLRLGRVLAQTEAGRQAESVLLGSAARLERPHVFRYRVGVDKVWQCRLGRVAEVAWHDALRLDLGIRLISERIQFWGQRASSVAHGTGQRPSDRL
jgi:hypothetical protein